MAVVMHSNVGGSSNSVVDLVEISEEGLNNIVNKLKEKEENLQNYRKELDKYRDYISGSFYGSEDAKSFQNTFTSYISDLDSLINSLNICIDLLKDVYKQYSNFDTAQANKFSRV